MTAFHVQHSRSLTNIRYTRVKKAPQSFYFAGHKFAEGDLAVAAQREGGLAKKKPTKAFQPWWA
jgi:hypothetical protein